MNPLSIKNKPIIFKIVMPITAVIILIGGILYYFSLKSIQDFADEHIRRDVLMHSREIYNICDKSLTELLYEGKADDEVSLSILKATNLDSIENLAKRQNLSVIISLEGRELLNVGLLDKTIFDNLKQGEISTVSIKNESFYVYFFDFQPWNWQIVIGKNYKEYAGVIGKVKTAYIIVFITLLIAALMLILSLSISIRNPLLYIIDKVEKGLPPNYKGTKEIEFLSNSISNMMQVLKERVQELEKAKKEIRIAKEFTDVILNSISDVVYVAEAHTFKIIRVNSVFLRAYKTTEEEIIGKTCHELIHNLPKPCPDCNAMKMLKDGKPLIYEKTIRSKKGKLNYLEVSASPVKDEKGEVTHLVFVSRNITERKRLEEQLRHSQKFESIGLLSGGIAHDFNNILTAIIGYANLLQMKIDKESPLSRYVQQIITSSDRAAELVKNLLAYSRKQIINPVNLDINTPIRNVEGLLKRLLEENIELHMNLSGDSLMVMADPIQIEQVLMNLATNARDAMPKGGKLIIETNRCMIDEDFIERFGYGRIGKYAKISVTDTGEGIDKQILGKIFDPFFTTKEVGKGTGLGLSMVYGIIKQHKGFINVNSEVGKGTSFVIYLPLSESVQNDTTLPEKKQSITLGQNGGETILLVEDEDFVRDMHTEILKNYGYKVFKASDGEEALEIFKEHKDKIRLVLTDIVMPKKNGWDLLQDIRKINQGIKVILISGYSQVLSDKSMLLNNNETYFIQKPISPDNLILKIKEILDHS